MTPTRIASDGDLIFEFHEPAADNRQTPTDVQLQVSSHVLCSASKVFASMLGPSSQFAEAVALRDPTRKAPHVIKLEDAPEAMEIVMNAVHHRNSLVPRKLEFQDMVLVAEICDKYDLYQALYFVITAWKEGIALKDHTADMLDKLSLAWVFRYEEVVSESTRLILLDGVCDEDGALIYAGKSLADALPEALTGESFFPLRLH